MTVAAYATVTELKALLDKTSASDDQTLQLALDGATTFINGETSRRFDSRAATLTFDGNGRRRMLVPDLVSVTAITMRPGTGQTAVALAASDYFIGPANPDDGAPYWWIDLSDAGDYSVWAKGFRTVAITGVWGWPAVPKDLKQVCMELATRFWKASQAGFNDRVGVDELGVQTYTKYLTTYDRLVLSRYRDYPGG